MFWIASLPRITTHKPSSPKQVRVGYRWNPQEPKNRDKNKGEKCVGGAIKNQIKRGEAIKNQIKRGKDNKKLKHKKGE
jgi:hypothetical protein